MISNSLLDCFVDNLATTSGNLTGTGILAKNHHLLLLSGAIITNPLTTMLCTKLVIICSIYTLDVLPHNEISIDLSIRSSLSPINKNVLLK